MSRRDIMTLATADNRKIYSRGGIVGEDWPAGASTGAARRSTSNDSSGVREKEPEDRPTSTCEDGDHAEASSSISSGVGTGRGIAAGLRECVGEGENAEAGRIRPATS